MARVALEHIWKRFGEIIAVEDLTFEAQDEEFLVLVGPSGCGKTTTLRMVAGLDDVTSGSIDIGNRLVNKLPPRDRDIAMVFQSYALYPHLNVFNNMAFGLKLRRTSRAEVKRRVHDAAEILGLAHVLARRPRQLSGGERQRVALGRAIVRNPAVFLMDEPLSNLDAKLRVQMRAELSKIHQQVKTTVIYVTHDQTEAMTMGDRIAVLNRGVLQQIDKPRVLYDSPANTFVAGFIGSPAMNLLSGRLGRRGEQVLFQAAAGFAVPLPQALVASLDGDQGAQVILGVRPEHLEVRADGQPDLIGANVEVVEHMGSELLAYMSHDGQPLTGRFSPNLDIRPGQSLNLRLSSDNVHLFDQSSGLAIGHSRSTALE